MIELATIRPDWHSRVHVCYPNTKQTCDWILGDPAELAIEIKMFRPNGLNKLASQPAAVVDRTSS